MFDLVILRQARGGLPVSAGQVAEALLFYQRVHPVMDRATLFALLRQLGPQTLLTLLQRRGFSAVYCEEQLATHSQAVGAFTLHRYVTFNLAGDQSVGELKTVTERLTHELERQGLDRKAARNFAQAFLRRVPVRRFSGDHFAEGGLPRAATQDLLDSRYAKRAVRVALQLMPGGYDPGESLKLDIVDTDLGLHVFHRHRY